MYSIGSNSSPRRNDDDGHCGAGHSLVVAQDPPAGGPNECQANASPFIDQCGYDQAGIILQHICGALNAPKRGALDGTVKQFAQSLYSKPNSVSSLSLGETGYGFVPKECGQGETCRVHIALHGYKQGVGDIDRGFVDYGGYNAWADTNRIIVLYPQPPPAGIPSARKPAGIGGVTWITTTATSPSRDRRSGHQGDARRGYPARGAGGGSRPCSDPRANWLKVIDTSDTAADLPWTPQPRVTATACFAPASVAIRGGWRLRWLSSSWPSGRRCFAQVRPLPHYRKSVERSSGPLALVAARLPRGRNRRFARLDRTRLRRLARV
jgi:hypothetical protein